MNESEMNEAVRLPNAVEPARSPTSSRGPSVAQIGVVVLILALGVGITAMTSKVTQMAEPGIRLQDGHPFLAEHVGSWVGGPLEGLTEGERKILPPDTEGARRVYKDGAGHEIFCSVVLEGRDVTSIHRPELCLTGQGFELEKPRIEGIKVATAPDGLLEVSRLDAARTVQLTDGRTVKTQSIFLYWFVGKERVTPSHPKRILITTFDRVFRNRNARWAYILIHAPLGNQSGLNVAPEDERATMQVVAKFVQDLYPTFALN
jgi:hypothetical protein